MPGRTAITGPSRRSFLQASTAAVLAGLCRPGTPLSAAESVVRNDKPFFKLSLAAYSFNRLLPRRPQQGPVPEGKISLFDFIDYCADLNIAGTELTSYYFPAEVTPDYLMEIKERTFRLGLDISGTAIGNNFCLPEGPERDQQLALTREWIDHAATIGAPVIRIFAGNVPKGSSEAEAIERCVAAIDESVAYAATKGVVLGLENHHGITASGDQLLDIVRRVKSSPWFGINFDSGNFRTENPYRDLEQIAPYAVNAQIKVSMAPKGGAREPADWGRVVQILKQAGYRGYLVLEYEEPEDPYQHIPRHLDALKELIS